EKLQLAGHATKADVLQARLQWKAVRLGYVAAQARFEMVWRQLTNVIGCPHLSPAPLIGNLDDSLPELDWNSSCEQLMANSPVLRPALVRIQHAQSELQRERAQRVPNLSLQVVVERDYQQNFTNVSTLVAAPVPVFNRNQGNIAHAAADIREAHAEVAR